MNSEEKDRLIEILFYLYFNNFPEKYAGSAEFWTLVRAICSMYKISDLAIIKAVRIIMVTENAPQDEETWYLLSQLGMTVRPMRKISGIYWQKQKEFAEKYKDTSKPTIRRRISDVVMKRSMRDFIFAIYDTLGIFTHVDLSLLEKEA